MFSTLSEKLTRTIRNLRGLGHLSEENMQETLREIRLALLGADVSLSVVKQFIEKIKEKALGQEVLNSLSPGQMLVKIVHDELVELLGASTSDINLNAAPPVIILMAGLQGSGKTTTSAKLAKYLTEHHKKKVLLASADVYRPAAIEQLRVLAGQIGIDFFDSSSEQNPIDIAHDARQFAELKQYDVLIFDTAGRLHIDSEMMDEIRNLNEVLQPTETLFVVDSMTGQDAVNTAKVFHENLSLTGVVLTKTDGDARGGAALSIKMVTGKPIKFMGTGEKIIGFEPFHPDRVASRILGMGDILTLVEEVERNIDKNKAKQYANKLKKGGFDLEDFLAQLQQMEGMMNNMGGMMGLVSKLPGMNNISPQMKQQMDENIIKRTKAIISSMTPNERRFPDIIKNTRKIRISKGSGTTVQQVNQLLKQYEQMQKMMKKLSKGGNMMRMMKNMGGMFPPSN